MKHYVANGTVTVRAGNYTHTHTHTHKHICVYVCVSTKPVGISKTEVLFLQYNYYILRNKTTTDKMQHFAIINTILLNIGIQNKNLLRTRKELCLSTYSNC
jgi:hypothetical protein